ncbi:stage IV sporulation protein FB [Lysinibacillus fusiformis]|uniref:stage IV sporulation protein FB n=1 Tax=Lysinibacillus fusiformis TaxID=28031 RepID=UPI00215AA8B6|nr:stage IV sporulation protein FB [Lysinibacillus fusiformis]MCR8852937.1 stage IV sporulation protein FB [Lysinibacillus fusiformis]WKT75551.1 stage IV sporulation protein FB [Lysinibacillus fusiformis]
MKIKLHLLCIPLVFVMIFSGQLAYYAIIFFSLMWHEAGHLLAALLCGVRVKSCVIAPYGGEIQFENPAVVQASSLLWIALGGPIATILGIGLAFFMPELIAGKLISVQLVLLLVNMIPILPLDGGRILLAWLFLYYPKAQVVEMYYWLSFMVATTLFLITLNFLPQSIFLAIICLFIWLQVLKEWRYRKYRIAFEKYVMNRLT